MRSTTAFLVILTAISLIGCASTAPPLTLPLEVNPDTAKADYWLSQPATTAVFCDNYDKLWDTCEELARTQLFTLDREDYRDGLLTTQPLISKQIFEPWRPDTGNFSEIMRNSLQTIRRTIQFDFQKLPSGYSVTAKVLVEQLAEGSPRITSSAEYGGTVSGALAGAMPLPGAQTDFTGPYWFAIYRDLDMEANLAKILHQRLGS